MAFHYSPKITTDGLLTYLDPANTYSYSGTGINWYDLGKRGASGSMVSGFAYDSASKSFYSASGVATTPTWITMDPGIVISDRNEYSLEFVVKMRPNAVNTFHSLCGIGQSHPWVGINGSPTSWKMFFRDSTTAYNNSSTITNYNLSSKPAALCFTFEANRTVKFYLNGSLVSSVVAVNTSINNITRLAGGYVSATVYHPFQGYFYSFRFYGKTLSDSEVLRNHLALATRFRI